MHVPCPCCDGHGQLSRRATQHLLIQRATLSTQTRCWVWTGAADAFGYGVLTHRNHRWNAHRLSYVAFGGTFDGGPVVRHACDRPQCFNPNHLSSGTPADNAHDRVLRGRSGASRGIIVPLVLTNKSPALPRWAPASSPCHCCAGSGVVDPQPWLSIIASKTHSTASGGCLIWTGKINKHGYGDVFFNRHRFLAHRLSLIAHTGNLTSKDVARHTCHNRACVAPDHLMPGTVLDNVRDRVSRGLEIKNHGANNGGARLTSVQVTEIRRRRLAGARLSSLMEEFNISENSMLRLTKGESWAKQDMDLLAQLAAVGSHRPGKPCRFSEEDFARMAVLRDDGWTLKAIASEYAVTPRMVGLYLKGRTLPQRAA